MSESWRRNLSIIFIGQLIGGIAMSGCLPFLPLYVRELGVTSAPEAKWWSGLVYAAPFMTSVLVQPFWGALADRFGRKLMLVRAYIGLALALSLMAFCSSVEQFFVLRVVQGLVSGFVSAGIALVAVMVPPTHAGYAQGMLQSALSSGAILGPLIGGLLSDFVGVRAVFFITAALCLLSGVIIFLKLPESRADRDLSSETGAANTVRGNINLALVTPGVPAILFFLCLSQFALTAMSPLLVYYVEALGAPTKYLGSITGILVGMAGVFGLILAPFWGKVSDRRSWDWVLKRGLPLVAGSIILQGLVVNYLWLFPLRAIMAVFSAAISPLLFSALSRQVPQHNRAGMMALGSSSSMIGQLTGPIFSGWLAGQLGLAWSFIWSGMVFLLMNLLLYFARKSDAKH